MKVGYIGLGLMGNPCGMHLLAAGHSLFVWARRKESAALLVAKGATFCSSAAEVAGKVDILFTNLTDTPDVEAVLLGEKGVREGAKAGLVVVDMSTISATATRRMAETLAESGITLVDAPVSGGTVGAENGTLTIMVGAEPEVFERIRPVLAAMGSSITRIGTVGSGQVAKSCNQIVITGTIVAVAEAIAFAEKNGVDAAPIREALLGGFASSRVLELHGKRMLDNNYTPGFKSVLHRKDIEIVVAIAAELGLALPVTQVGYGLLQKSVEHGYSEEDSAALFKVVKSL